MRYGVASLKGLWVLDASIRVPVDEAEKYRLRFIDFFHAFMSILVFLAVALFPVVVKFYLAHFGKITVCSS